MSAALSFTDVEAPIADRSEGNGADITVKLSRRARASGQLAMMIRLPQLEDWVGRSRLRKFNDFVDKHPEEALAVARGWINQEG